MSKVQPEEKVKKWSFSDPTVRKLIQRDFDALKPRLFDYVDHYAATRPSATAFIEYDTGEVVTWSAFQKASIAFAVRLQEYGIGQGDIVVTSLPMLKLTNHLVFRLGAIIAPLDLRLKATEIDRNFDKIKPKLYAFLGMTPIKDFCPIVKEVMKKHHKKNGGSVEVWLQFQKDETKGILDGAMHIKSFMDKTTVVFQYVMNQIKGLFGCGTSASQALVGKRDGCLIVFTTGSTGMSKAALLQHEACLGVNVLTDYGIFKPLQAKDLVKKDQPLACVNLPPSHVGCLVCQLMTVIYLGGPFVVLNVFHPQKTLDAIQKYKCLLIAQIPACYNLEWALKDYSKYDLSSLRYGMYGGQAASEVFSEKLKKMVNGHFIGSGYGLTEMGGLGVFTDFEVSPSAMQKSIGYDTPITKLSVREKMGEDGKAGKQKQSGEVGEVCFEGPTVFLKYIGDVQRTKETVSADGILYTGDLGSYDPEGVGFKFASRRKFVIKPKGYQVFPTEVEDFIQNKFKSLVKFIGVVGVEHGLYTDGVVAVIKLFSGEEKKKKVKEEEEIEVEKDEEEDEKEGEERIEEEEEEEEKFDLEELERKIREWCKSDIASYKRPMLYVFLGEKEEFPLNRSKKSNYLELRKIGQKAVEEERKNGGWDVTE